MRKLSSERSGNSHKFSIKQSVGKREGLLKDSILHKHRCCFGVNCLECGQPGCSFLKSSNRKLHGNEKRTTQQSKREKIAARECSCLTSQEISANCLSSMTAAHGRSIFTLWLFVHAYMLLYSVWYAQIFFIIAESVPIVLLCLGPVKLI